MQRRVDAIMVEYLYASLYGVRPETVRRVNEMLGTTGEPYGTCTTQSDCEYDWGEATEAEPRIGGGAEGAEPI
jgi:hypothetical protein